MYTSVLIATVRGRIKLMKQTGFKMVKMDKELHGDLKLYALKNNMPLYQVIATACLKFLKSESKRIDKKK